MKWLVMMIVASILLAGCAGIQPIDETTQTKTTYDFIVKGKSKTEIFKTARDFFAGGFGDSRAVFRVTDEKEGVMIGRGTAQWEVTTIHCMTDYHIRFAAKDEKARLQFELIYGHTPGSECTGWSLPSKNGYKEILESFENIAKNLEQSLHGKSTASDFMNF